MATPLSSIKKPLINGLNKLSGWVLFFAILWLCWGIARIVWLVVAPPKAPNLPVLPIQAKQTAQIDANRALAIFEMPKSQQQQSEPPPNVILAGVMPSTLRSFSSAMINVNGTMANYRIGEELAGTSHTLVDVRWDSILIEDSRGKQSEIKMPERMSLDQSDALRNNPGNNSAMRGQIPAPTTQPRTDQSANNIQRPPRRFSLNPEGRDNNANSNGNPQAAIDKAINELRENPAGYLSSMGVMATGEGYEVTDAMPAKLRKRIGLEAGDRVLSVNGQPVGSNPASDADLLNQVKQSGQATIEVQRGEQTLTVRQQF